MPNRIVDVTDTDVTFRYKDYADGSASKTMTLSAEEFLRRFLTHVLPKGFVKIRHYGLLANRRREERLTLCRRLLAPRTVLATADDANAAKADAVAIDPAQPPRCPHCGGGRFARFELPPQRGGDGGDGVPIDTS